MYQSHYSLVVTRVTGYILIVLHVSSRKLLIQFTTNCILKYQMMRLQLFATSLIKNTLSNTTLLTTNQLFL
jgi:hypothetical protein